LYSTSHLFFLGDLNFRLALPQTNPYAGRANFGRIEAALNTQSGREELKEFDELLQERRKGTVFQGFREGEFWSFKCSYKFKIGEVDKYRLVKFAGHRSILINSFSALHQSSENTRLD
jgi:hypothetical protein